MVEIVFGTTNPGKLADVRTLIEPYDARLLSLNDFDLGSISIEESGSTFAENAQIKYETLRPLIPDEYLLVTEDAGLEVDALAGEPGVYSRRWNTERREMTDEELVQKMLTSLAGKQDRTARFVVTAMFGGAGLPMQLVRRELVGMMLDKPRDGVDIEPGLPYRAFFYIPSLDKMLYEVVRLPRDERPGILTHRELAWEEIMRSIQHNN